MIGLVEVAPGPFRCGDIVMHPVNQHGDSLSRVIGVYPASDLVLIQSRTGWRGIFPDRSLTLFSVYRWTT